MADPFAAVAHDDPFASVAQPVAAPQPLARNPTTPFANPKAKPMFDTRALDAKMDAGMDALGEAGKHVGSTALDLLGRPGQAGVAAVARGPQAAGQAFLHGDAPNIDRDMDTFRHKVGLADTYNQKSKPGREWMGQAGRGLIDAGLQAAVDPTTLLGSSGAIEEGVNKLGRLGYVAAAKGMAKENPISRTAATFHDFVTPGGSAAGAAKRTITAQQGEAGLDKYLAKKADVKAAGNAEPVLDTPVHGPATINSNAHAISPHKSSRLAPQVGFGKPKMTPDQAKKFYADLKVKQAAASDDALLAPVGKKPEPLLGGGLANVANLAKKATKGTTSLMFATPQLPGMQGHGSNILQTAFLSNPEAALGGTGRYLASGEPLPGKLREAYQKLPGVKNLVAGQNASAARARATGALTEQPEKDRGFLDKIPGVKQLADYSSRTLWGYDDAMKGALNDAWTKHYLEQGLPAKTAAARASDRVGQDIVDYGDKSDLTRTLAHGLPFATYATKKPGIIARAAVRHPERVLALTRNNPNYSSDRTDPMSDPDQGRPMASIYNALNNKSPGAKGGGPFPGSQYVRASAGAPADDLMGMLNSYFTYGPPAKHADGNALMGWLKLLLSQSVGNVTGGDQVLNKTGLNYFGNQ